MSDRDVPLPACLDGSGTAGLATGIANWIGSGPIRSLVDRFGGRWPDGDMTRTLDALDDFSARHWDFRGGRERPEAREPGFDAATIRLIQDAAESLGLVRPRSPARSGYAHLVVLGGLAYACLRRTAYAADVLRTGLPVTGEVAVLGSFRPLNSAERRILADAGIDGCVTEVDALDAGVRAAFGVTTPDDETTVVQPEPHACWSARRYRPPGLPPVRVLAAPSSEPAVRRAHTADTQRFWAEHVRLAPGDPVLMVTTPIYVPFQHCDALRTLALPYGCGIDTIGVDPAFRSAAWPTEPARTGLPPNGLAEPPPTPGRYLQEIRSAIRSMRALHAALADHQHSESVDRGPFLYRKR